MSSRIKGNIVFWFRRDLRIEDNHGLYQALRDNSEVIPVFIFDKNILDKLEDKQDRRVEFIHQNLYRMNEQLKQLGSRLEVLYGDPVEIYKEFTPDKLYLNRDYEPYARERDTQVEKNVKSNGGEVYSFKDQVIFEKDEITKDDGSPYSVFTPFSKKWKANFDPESLIWEYDTENYYQNFQQTSTGEIIPLKDIGFETSDPSFPDSLIDKKVINTYSEKRDIPSVRGTSRLSVHFRFGTISIRKALKESWGVSETWVNELIWREFYSMILWNFPHVADTSFKPKYDRIQWRNNEEEFEAWCEGRTGYPIVDAGMRELNSTGFMHNRVRMITASFLVKHLLIDWRWGEAYFAKKLLDFDLASNNGGWQWASGSGCDAAPYFRVFNPELQTKKFDPELKYIKQWVPEYQEFNYPKPIVEHKFARNRALETYKEALG